MRVLPVLPAVCAAALLGGCYSMSRAVTEEMLARQGPPPRVDAIVVPGCPALPDGKPSTCIRRRVSAAVAAFREGLAPRLLFSGGPVHNGANEAQVMADLARSMGVPERALLLEPRARHTVENLQLSASLLEARGLSRVLIVSDVLQLPMAVELAQREGLRAWGRLAHPDLPARQARRRVTLDAWEPIPAAWWK